MVLHASQYILCQTFQYTTFVEEGLSTEPLTVLLYYVVVLLVAAPFALHLTTTKYLVFVFLSRFHCH